MAKRSKSKPELNSATVDSEPKAESAYPVSGPVRALISLGIVVYLSIVIIGPLANPIGSEHLARPLARFVSPLHQALFLGHGYRFFGPDPGPSHLVFYQIQLPDGTQIEGRFPDRDEYSPRLLYHRWFMLSETIYDEHAFTPDAKSYRETQRALEAQISELRLRSYRSVANQLQRQYDEQRFSYERARKRIDLLVSAVARRLIQTRSPGSPLNGTRIKLYVQERVIPPPTDIQMGNQLADPEYLMLPVAIGEFEFVDGDVRKLGDSESGPLALPADTSAGEGGR